MKQIKMHIVKTTHQNVDRPEKFFINYVSLGTDYHSGWGLRIDANKIISEETAMVDVLEPGDRVSADLWRGSFQDEDGISSGGKMITKTGVVESAHGDNGTHGFIKFDDGDFQSISLIRGDDGYPGSNIQPTDQTIIPTEKLVDYIYEKPEEPTPFHQCPEPYRRGIGMGFGRTEDGEAE